MTAKPPFKQIRHCYNKCIHRNNWTKEMPYMIESDNLIKQFNTMMVCFSCIHFVRVDNFSRADKFYSLDEEKPKE